MFEQLVDQYHSLRKGSKLTDEELAGLIVEAKLAAAAHPAVWAKFFVILRDFTDLKPPEAKSEYRRCRITADLGLYPYSVTDFVSAFLKSRGYRMRYSGDFGNATDADFIINQMMIWSHEIVSGQTIFPDGQIKAAFSNWMVVERGRLMAAAYQKIAFDAQADATELTRFAAFMIEPADDPAVTERNNRACEIAIRNFIFRTKNHMRGRWCHSIHLMPVFAGPQGSGKTTAVKHLLSPLGDLSSNVGFDLFDHDAKMFTLSTIPVMFFDELGGITKADVERLKDLMTAEQRDLRQPYGRPVNRTLIWTGIGCTNKDVSILIKDETGNRRFIQFDTPALLSRAAILGFDVMAIWRSVDEDGEPPLYANAADLEAVQRVQAEQKHLSRVEEWIADQDNGVEFAAASDLYLEQFQPWIETRFPGQGRFENVVSFGKELNRLIRCQHPRLSKKHGRSKPLYGVAVAA